MKYNLTLFCTMFNVFFVFLRAVYERCDDERVKKMTRLQEINIIKQK